MSPSATPAMHMERQCHQVPRLPRKVAQRPGRLKRAQAHHQSKPSAISTTPATQSEGGCHQVPRLPRKWNVNVTKCHGCHTKWRRAPAIKTRASAPPEPAQCHKYHSCHAK